MGAVIPSLWLVWADEVGPGCEPISQGFLRELVSTYSSLAFVVAAVVIVLLGRRRRRALERAPGLVEAREPSSTVYATGPPCGGLRAALGWLLRAQHPRGGRPGTSLGIELLPKLLPIGPGRLRRPDDEGPATHVTAGHGPFTKAEDGGFEPPRAFTQHAFQACAIGH